MGVRNRNQESMPEKWRERIKTGVLLKRLADHALGKLEMSQTQIRAAEILLKKVMPDLRHIEHTGKVQHEYTREELETRLESFGIDPAEVRAAIH